MPARLLIVSFSVCPAPDRHGVGLQNVLKALGGRYTVDVLTLRPQTGELPYVERYLKTRMLRVPVGHGTLSEQVHAFRRAIKRQLEGEEYDVVHVRSAWGAHAVLQGGGGRIVYEVARSTEGEPRAADAQVAAALADEEDACVSRADLVIVPTETARRHLIGSGGAEASRVTVIAPGVDIDHFDWEPGDAAGPPRIVYAGRLGAGRGVRLLLDAVAALKRKRELCLVLAGPIEPAFQPILDEAIAARGLSGAVELLGAIEHDDVPRILAQALVCVAPSSPDERDRPLAGFPTKLLEYMACRRPVVAPRRASVEEVLTDGKEGLLFEPGDAAALERALGRLLDDEVLREQVADAAYARVRDEHPASGTRRKLLEAYARLLPGAAFAPPGRAVGTIDALPSHPDTTTARRRAPADLGVRPPAIEEAIALHHPEGEGTPRGAASADGRARGERSGEIVIPPTEKIEIPVVKGEIVIEALDFAEAGEPLAAPLQEGDVDSAVIAVEPEPFGDGDEHTIPNLTVPKGKT